MAILEVITQDEIEFMECLVDSCAMAETLFNDFDNLQLYSDNEFGHIRQGQLSMLSHEYIIDDNDPALSKKENFKRLEGAGTLYNFGARRFGKSLISLIIDMLESLVHLDNWHTLYSSYDALHILQILERVIPASLNHPFFKLFDVQTKRSPNYVITAKNGFELQSVNMNVSSKAAGSNFFGHHTKKLWIDEMCLDGKSVVRCLTPEKKLIILPISQVVNKQLWKKYQVLSYNLDKNILEFKPIKNIFKKQIFNDYRYKITLDYKQGWKENKLICSKNERLYTQEGYKQIEDISLNDTLHLADRSLLTLNQKEIALGCLLGDSCYGKNNTIGFIHGLKQENYLDYKINCFSNLFKYFNNKKRTSIKYNSKSICGSPTVGASSKVCSDLEIFKDLKNENNGTTFTNLNETTIRPYFTPIALAFWYMDDGSLKSYYKKDKTLTRIVTLHTEGYNYNTQKLLVKLLKEYYNIDATIVNCTPYYRLRLNPENSNIFLNIVEEYIEPSMRYKIYPISHHDKINFKPFINFTEDKYLLAPVSILSIEKQQFKKWTMYDLDVEDNENFIANGVLVHNSKTTHEVAEKMADAVSELGSIQRFCVSEGTKILMSDFTTKNIEDINKNDKIIAWNEDKRYLEETVVKNKFDSGKRDVINLKNSKDNLWLTPEHKIRAKEDGGYGWRKTEEVLTKKLYADSLSYIDNEINYYKGALLGLLDSDGRCQVIQGVTKVCYQYGLCQANEVDFFKYVLKYLNINYSEDIDYGQRKGTYTKKEKPIHHFRIKREHNDFIQQTYQDLKNDRDIQLGYLAGFVIGDGWLGGSAAIEISQNYLVNKEKIDRIIETADKLNINYRCDKQIKKNEWRVYFPKYSLVLPLTSEKGKKYKNILLKHERYAHKTEKLFVDGLKPDVQVYDIETDLHSFIANGFIVHNSGMTDFTRHSPAGKIYDDYLNKNWVCNFPQYISPMWDEGERQKMERRYGGSKTVAYRTFVKGEVCEDGISVFDMQRVRLNYNEKKKIKTFEINKENFKSYKNILVVERPANAGVCITGADIGETAPTEIVVTFKIADKFNYMYNITLYNLTDKQQYQIFKYLFMILNIDYLGLDCGDGTGRAIFRRLEEDLGRDRLFYYDGSKKIAVGYNKNDSGEITLVNGKPELIEEFMSEWSVKHLKTLLYDEKMMIPQDFKFDTQINSVISVTLSNRTVYECVAPANHLFDAFRVWSLTQWMVGFNENLVPRKAFSKTGC